MNGTDSFRAESHLFFIPLRLRHRRQLQPLGRNKQTIDGTKNIHANTILEPLRGVTRGESEQGEKYQGKRTGKTVRNLVLSYV